jgi:hypothetical protein
VVVVVKGAIGTAIAQPSIAFLGDQQIRIEKKAVKAFFHNATEALIQKAYSTLNNREGR